MNKISNFDKTVIIVSRSKASNSWILAIILCCILGVICTAILTATHYRIAEEGLMQKSFCTLSSTIDCDIPLTSAYSHIWRIPNSEIGLLFYVLVAVLATWARINEKRRESIVSFIVLASGAAFIYALYMASLLLWKLAVICLFCMASHLLTTLIFIFALKSMTQAPWKLPRRALVQYLSLSLVVYVMGTLFFFGLNEAAHSKEPTFNKSALLLHFYRQEPLDFATEKRPTWGQSDAPVTIVDISDFQCPYCRRAAFSLKPYVGEFRKEVKIVYLNYPLDSSCNPHIQQGFHPAACIAAKAGLCAYKKNNGSFWKLHDLIFENQSRLTQHLIVESLAPQAGISSGQMRECLDTQEIAKSLDEDIAMGQKAGIQGTPAIFINGRYLNGWADPLVLRTIIAAEIARAKGNPPPEYLRATQ